MNAQNGKPARRPCGPSSRSEKRLWIVRAVGSDMDTAMGLERIRNKIFEISTTYGGEDVPQTTVPACPPLFVRVLISS